MRALSGVTSVLVAATLIATAGTTAQATTQVSSSRTGPTERSLLGPVAPTGVGNLYALNDLTHHVVRFDLRDGRWQTSLIGSGWRDPTRLAVTRRGVAWVVDGTNVVRVAPSGRQRVVLQLTEAGAFLATDRAGNAYVNDGDTVLEIAHSGRTVTTRGTVTDAIDTPAGLGVDAAGNATLVYRTTIQDDTEEPSDVAAVTFPADGGAPQSRFLSEFSPEQNLQQVQEAPTGALAIHTPSTGASGYVSTTLYAPGADTGRDATTKQSATVTTFDSRGLLYVLQWRNWCNQPSIDEGQCVPDRAVDQAVVQNSFGSYSTVPITGLTVPDGGLAADAHGRIFASEGGSGSSPLLTVAPGGGPARVIIDGRFFALTVAYGH